MFDDIIFDDKVDKINVSWAIGREIYRWFEDARDNFDNARTGMLVQMLDNLHNRILGFSESKLNWDTVAYGPEVPHSSAFYLLSYVIEDAIHDDRFDWDQRWCEIAFQVPEAGIQKYLALGLDDREAAEAMSSLEIMNVRSK